MWESLCPNITNSFCNMCEFFLSEFHSNLTHSRIPIYWPLVAEVKQKAS